MCYILTFSIFSRPSYLCKLAERQAKINMIQIKIEFK